MVVALGRCMLASSAGAVWSESKSIIPCPAGQREVARAKQKQAMQQCGHARRVKVADANQGEGVWALGWRRAPNSPTVPGRWWMAVSTPIR